MSEYPKYPSIERFENIYSVISEKVDGTNGLMEIHEVFPKPDSDVTHVVTFGSRNKWIDVHSDNAGFANFFTPHIDKIVRVPEILKANAVNELDNRNKACNMPIRIYGEWFGQSIQRTYGLKQKLFMPFHTLLAKALIEAGVPNIIEPFIFYTGKFDKSISDGFMDTLKTHGSCVVPGYFQAEGIVVYFPTYNFCLKDTFEGAKWKQQASSTV